MIVSERITAETYERIALSDPSRSWELHQGRLREKPGMSWEHGDVIALLSHLLQHQLDRNEFRVRINDGRVRRGEASIYIPDIIVFPTGLGEQFRGRPGTLPVFDEPLPLVIEVWSPSTGDYDVSEKLGEYQRRADLEIWRIHPYERTLTTWRRQPDGSYPELIYHEGTVQPSALPHVAIDLTPLFDDDPPG